MFDLPPHPGDEIEVRSLLMKNPNYRPATRARRQRLSRQLTAAWRLALVVAVNFSVWIVAEDFEPTDTTPSVNFTPLLAEADPVASQGQPEGIEAGTETTGEPEEVLTESDDGLSPAVEWSDPLTEEDEPLQVRDRMAVTTGELPALDFLRPDWVAATDRYRPSRESEKHTRKGLRVHLDTGYGHDSSTRPGDEGEPTIERNGGVSWLEIGGSYDGDFGLDDGALFFYGSNFGGGLYSVERSEFVDGSETVDLYLNPYIGLQGQKTLLQLDGFYDEFQGNDNTYKNSGRESLGAAGLRTGVRFSGVRLFDHSTITAAIDYSVEDFDRGEALNDRESWIGDLSWLYQPSRFPKVDAGAGVRFGEYFTSLSPNLIFAEPSLRARYKFSPKTGFEGRVGYLFRDYEAEESAHGDGDVVFAMTADWQASERTHLQLQAYRDSSPSVQNDGEYYTSTGVRTDVGYLMPFLRLHLTLSAAYEYADYGSTTGKADADRSDDYFWISSALSRRLDVDWLADPTVSLFYNHREIASNRPNRDFTQDFAGVKLRFDF